MPRDAESRFTGPAPDEPVLRLPFVKLLPGGNPTLLLPGECVPTGALAALSARLMSPLHLGAEQVGALFSQKDPPHLEMMGGEFCVNATRAAAYELAGRGLLPPFSAGARAGALSVSGLDAPVFAAAALDEGSLRACREHLDAHGFSPAARTAPDRAAPPAAPADRPLFCAARIPLAGAEVLRLAPGVVLVRLPGICHLLLDAALHPPPNDLFTAAAAERARHNLDALPAAGVIWHSATPAGPAITPLVRVAATDSTHHETACGSASLALALARGEGARVRQPSGGTLEIDFSPGAAWVSGRVDCIARGETVVRTPETFSRSTRSGS